MNSKTLLLTCVLCSPMAIMTGCDNPDSTVDQAVDTTTNAAQTAADTVEKTVENAADTVQKAD